MPLGEPPVRARLRALPAHDLDGQALHRVHRADRSPWWFRSADDTGPAGRFDLAPPHGSCYLATTPQSAVLEALQADFAGGSLPVAALRRRALSTTTVPDGSPPAAALTRARAAGAGVTVALWADRDRDLTRRWAAELHGCGWQALYHGTQHDPTGRGRAVTLFDRTGAHAPWGADWPEPDRSSLDHPDVRRILVRHGMAVADDPHPDLEVIA